jgi:hypothetical protein
VVLQNNSQAHTDRPPPAPHVPVRWTAASLHADPKQQQQHQHYTSTAHAARSNSSSSSRNDSSSTMQNDHSHVPNNSSNSAAVSLRAAAIVAGASSSLAGPTRATDTGERASWGARTSYTSSTHAAVHQCVCGGFVNLVASCSTGSHH